jgi:hypothetical protein
MSDSWISHGWVKQHGQNHFEQTCNNSEYVIDEEKKIIYNKQPIKKVGWKIVCVPHSITWQLVKEIR